MGQWQKRSPVLITADCSLINRNLLVVDGHDNALVYLRAACGALSGDRAVAAVADGDELFVWDAATFVEVLRDCVGSPGGENPGLSRVGGRLGEGRVRVDVCFDGDAVSGVADSLQDAVEFPSGLPVEFAAAGFELDGCGYAQSALPGSETAEVLESLVRGLDHAPVPNALTGPGGLGVLFTDAVDGAVCSESESVTGSLEQPRQSEGFDFTDE